MFLADAKAHNVADIITITHAFINLCIMYGFKIPLINVHIFSLRYCGNSLNLGRDVNLTIVPSTGTSIPSLYTEFLKSILTSVPVC